MGRGGHLRCHTLLGRGVTKRNDVDAEVGPETKPQKERQGAHRATQTRLAHLGATDAESWITYW